MSEPFAFEFSHDGTMPGVVAPVSFAQQRLWFLEQLHPHSPLYNVAMAMRLSRELDVHALERSLNEIVARHEVLRTTFSMRDGEPVQIIAERLEIALAVTDLVPRAELENVIASEVMVPFDLTAGPLLRARLLPVAPDEHVLQITVHHIVADGWSMGTLARELSVLYGAYRDGRPSPLPALPIQYADYAAWQRRWLTDEYLRGHAAYWRATLAGAPALLELPTDRPRPAAQNYAGASVCVDVDAELTARLKALGHRHGTTLFMTVLSAWAVLLARLSGEDDIVIGTPVANRTLTEVESLIGFFVNTLALRLDLSGSPSVREALERVRTQVLAAQQHQDLSFEQVVEVAKPSRSLEHAPIFQVMFAWQHGDDGGLVFPGLDVAPVATPSIAAQFDLTLSLATAGNRIVGKMEYATALFDRATIERYSEYLQRLLAAMAADDRQNVMRLPMLADVDRRRMLVEWNATQTPYPSGRCIHELFEDQAGEHADAVAVAYESTVLSYGELNAQANRLARYLRDVGVKPDARVALCVERGAAMVVGLLAVLKAGGAYVPLDPSYPVDRLRYMLNDSAPVVVLTHDAVTAPVLHMLRGGAAPVVDLQADAARWEAASSANVDPGELTPAHLAYVIYTSGSTGQPKGVMVEHRGLCNLAAAQAQALAVEPSSRVLQCASISFDAAIFEVIMALCRGASLCVPSQGTVLAGEALAEVVRARAITHLTLTPAALASLPEGSTLESVRTLIAAGEALTGTLARRHAAHRRLINAYGPTEATVWATMYECRADSGDAPPIGRPIANVRTYVLDAQREPVPVGVSGELYIGGAGVARGYLNRPELTLERFVTDPFAGASGARMYKTGDVARYLSDGNIEFVGRSDCQVKVRGFRIELGEIEARLVEHPGIGQAVVVAREDTCGDKRLVAYYTPDSSQTIEAESLRADLRSVLPEWMLPTAYVALETFALTPNGKLDRKALPPPEGVAHVRSTYEDPVGPVETAVAEIWSDALQVERIGRHDNFFELGGHSLLALRAASSCTKIGLRIGIADIFQRPTVQSLVASLEQPEPARAFDAIPVRAGGRAVPLFLLHDVHGLDLYFPSLAAHLSDEDMPVYGIPGTPQGAPVLHTIEAIAARLVRIIRCIRESGPYRLAGWSFGGLLAYEVSVQLLQERQAVEFLGLLDTRTPAYMNRSARYGVALEERVRPLAAALQEANDDVSLEELLRRCEGAGVYPLDVPDQSIARRKHYLARLFAHLQAYGRYRVRPSATVVDLFVAQDGLPEDAREVADSSLGWADVLPAQQLRVDRVPGNHWTMMDSHVGALGVALSRAIERAGCAGNVS